MKRSELFVHKPKHDAFILKNVQEQKNGTNQAGLRLTALAFHKEFGVKRTPRSIEARYHRILAEQSKIPMKIQTDIASGFKRYLGRLDRELADLKRQVASTREQIRIFRQLGKTARRFEKI